MRVALYLITILLTTLLQAATYHIGPTQSYSSPNALYLAEVLADGDSILIDAATYTGTDALAVWLPDELTIIGVGGRPHLVADGEYIWGKGIWVCAGDDITVENIEFSGAAVPDENGAGIRLDGNGLTVRQCFFHDNENGILTNNSDQGQILIEHSEFADNGTNGFNHNLYIGHCERLVFRFNYSHHAHVGHTLKSRADENIITYNLIMDGETGNSSRLIDLSNGGFSLIMGNYLLQGENAENNNLIGYGLEGTDPTNDNSLYVVNNTMHNDRVTGLFVSLAASTAEAVISNNIMSGIGTPSSGPVGSMESNLISIDPSAIGYIDLSTYDVRLSAASTAIDAGSEQGFAEGFSLTPVSTYVHPTGAAARPIVDGVIDIGAFEFGEGSTCASDLNGNGQVDVVDFLILNSDYGSSCQGCTTDLDGSGEVDINDFILFNSEFGAGCN